METANHFKRTYTPEDLHELKAWYEKHEAELPEEVQLDSATRWTSIKTAVKAYLELCESQGDNPTFSGQLCQLYTLRECLIKMGVGE